MVYDAELARTDTSCDDERTASVISQIANSIENNIQFTVDYPSRNENGRMAVLDLEIWIQDYKGRQMVTHSFYKKKVASPFTI